MTRKRLKKSAISILALAGVVALGWSFPDGSTKTKGPWRAFNEAWFAAHQGELVDLLNASSAARSALCVDLPMAIKVNAIGPNRVTYGAHRLAGGRVEATTDFRTHAKWSKRVYRIGKPLWWLAHGADFALDRCAPPLSFGLSTLTAYPDPSHGATTVDGFADPGDNPPDTWHHLTTAAGAHSNDTGVDILSGYQDGNPGYVTLWRSLFTFDTSALGGATISAAVLSLYGYDKLNQTGTADWNSDIYTSTPVSNNAVADADYQNIGTTSQTGSPISYSSFTVGAYNDFTFNSTGRSNVSTTGVSKFGWRNPNYDVGDASPTGGHSNAVTYQAAYAADQTGTSNDPKLVVTYSAAAASFNALNVAGD